MSMLLYAPGGIVALPFFGTLKSTPPAQLFGGAGGRLGMTGGVHVEMGGLPGTKPEPVTLLTYTSEMTQWLVRRALSETNCAPVSIAVSWLEQSSAVPPGLFTPTFP